MEPIEDCRTCAAESAVLESERQRALRELDLADFAVNQARARLADVDNKIANRHARQCRDHQEARAAHGHVVHDARGSIVRGRAR